MLQNICRSVDSGGERSCMIGLLYGFFGRGPDVVYTASPGAAARKADFFVDTGELNAHSFSG